MNPRPSPLRDRQRRKTAGEIQHATLNLVRQYGLEHVTTEMIAEEAGVSPRTFSAAMVGPPINLHEAALAEFSAARGPLTRDFGRLLLMQFRDNADRKATIRAVDEVIGLHPELEPEFLRSLSAVTTQLAAGRAGLSDGPAGRGPDAGDGPCVQGMGQRRCHDARSGGRADRRAPRHGGKGSCGAVTRHFRRLSRELRRARHDLPGAGAILSDAPGSRQGRPWYARAGGC